MILLKNLNKDDNIVFLITFLGNLLYKKKQWVIIEETKGHLLNNLVFILFSLYVWSF